MTVVFLGDGTLGQGTVYECLNLASLWSLPILFLVENNHYAQTTPRGSRSPARFPTGRCRSASIRSHLDTTDVLGVHGEAGRAIDRVRSTGRPAYLVDRHVPLQPALEGRRHAGSGRDRGATRTGSADRRRQRSLAHRPRDAVEAAVRDAARRGARDGGARARRRGGQRLWPDRCAARTHSTRPCTRSSSSVTTSFSSARTSSTPTGERSRSPGVSASAGPIAC